MIKELIAKVVREEDLTEDEMAAAMDEIMTGAATPAQIGAFITALRLKGETVDEITGAARTMRAKATKININNHAREREFGCGNHQSFSVSIWIYRNFYGLSQCRQAGLLCFKTYRLTILK